MSVSPTGIVRAVLLVIGGVLALIVVFQTFASPVLVDGGSRIVTVYAPPLNVIVGALALYALALIAEVTRTISGAGRISLLIVAFVATLLAANRITQDAVRGEITHDWALMPLQRVKYDVADGPMPVLEFSTWTVTVTSVQNQIIVFRGIPPIRVGQEPFR